ncbi:putative E3 ubiquitin-protein ligase DTX3 [Ciona intestinalis]
MFIGHCNFVQCRLQTTIYFIVDVQVEEFQHAVEEFQHAESSENIENNRFDPIDSQDNLFAGACSKQLSPSKCIGEGTQPEDGEMQRQRDYFPLSGYNCHTITIVYTFKGGIQDNSHPVPGKTYNGCTETAYLPDNSEGQSVYRLLHRAFEKGLTFGVGMCETSKQYRVMFKDIPHKTNPTGGKEGDGYPDNNYMTEVVDALRSYGITE